MRVYRRREWRWELNCKTFDYSDLSIQVGDVIYVEANSGAVKRQGRSDTFATEFDLEAEEYVPLPKVEIFQLITVDNISIPGRCSQEEGGDPRRDPA